MEYIIVRQEEEKDYRKVEEITRATFNYPERILRGNIDCPYEHWMVHELRQRDGIIELSLVAQLKNGTIVGHIICSKAVVYGISDAEGHNYPAFMSMELKEGYLKDVCGGKFFESDIYNDKLNRKTVIEFDRTF